MRHDWRDQGPYSEVTTYEGGRVGADVILFAVHIYTFGRISIRSSGICVRSICDLLSLLSVKDISS